MPCLQEGRRDWHSGLEHHKTLGVLVSSVTQRTAQHVTARHSTAQRTAQHATSCRLPHAAECNATQPRTVTGDRTCAHTIVLAGWPVLAHASLQCSIIQWPYLTNSLQQKHSHTLQYPDYITGSVVRPAHTSVTRRCCRCRCRCCCCCCSRCCCAQCFCVGTVSWALVQYATR
jgi:hypothetical protein